MRQCHASFLFSQFFKGILKILYFSKEEKENQTTDGKG
jgi:hypothetical protein